MAYQFMGPLSGFVPAYDKQAQLIVNYSRDPKSVKVNKLVTNMPVSKITGLYPKINPLTKVNTTATHNQSRKWAYGTEAPRDHSAATEVEWNTYFTQRYYENDFLDWVQKDQTDFDIQAVMVNNLANRMMNSRSLELYDILTTSGNYSNTGTATAAGGGQWSAATSTARYIQKSLATGTEAIVQATGGGVGAKDLVLVVSPVVAHKMAASGEIADYLAQNPLAKDYLEGDLFADQLAMYGLPPKLYGITCIVDDTVKATNRLGATDATAFVASETSAFLIARPGSLMGTARGTSFSFVQNFLYSPEEMLVETLDDVRNKRTEIRVIDNRVMVPVAKEAGYLFTSVVA